MPIEPQPCGDGAGSGGGPDVEQVLLCDVLADGEIAGTALAVYEYDETGAPVGAPTFVNPATGLPYVPVGILQPCPGDVGCGAPTQFCFQSTAPVDQPGRMYDTVLTLGQGFAVQSLVKDLVETPLNIVWEVTDPTGAAFASTLQTAIASQFAGQTVTVTPGAVDPCTGGTATFAVHIECLRIDQTPPSLLQFKYNSGRDLIVNPAFLSTPNTGQFAFLKRQDGASSVSTGSVLCTNVANKGWQTNDIRNSFETWGPPGSAQNVAAATTPPPRGTVVQEINSYGSGAQTESPGFGNDPNTIWQTFVVPAAGNFTVRVVVGGRASTENIAIKLSTGDVDAAGIGDVINTSVNAGQVTTQDATGNNTGTGTAGPWTTFNQTVPLAAGTYTLAFTGPPKPPGPGGNAFGGLFTDMRVFQDAPGTVQAFTNDDNTCVVPTTETSTICEFWAPRCSAGQIVGWYNVADGEELTNAQFWAQVPAPTCCSGSSDQGMSSVGNLVHTYLVCATLNGEQRTMSRVVVSDQAGGIIADSFIDTDGAPVTPSTWQPGDCSGNTPPTFAGFVCDVFGGAPSLPAVAPTCPGFALAAPQGLTAGDGMTEGPAGTYTPTSGSNAYLSWGRSPDDDQHAICSLKFVNDPGTGDDPLWQLIGSFVDANGNGQSLDPVWITAITTALGTSDLTDIPPGTTATAPAGGTSVTITFDGPSTHSQMFGGNGAFFVREQDGDGLAAGVTLAFDPPIRSFLLFPNVTAPTPGSFSGLQESRATPGTAPIPAAPASVTEVKQFRSADGTSFYENLDGTPHTVLGTVGECGTYFQEQLCDSPTGVEFLRVYTVTGGAVSAFQDYDLDGVPYAVTGIAGRCQTEVADLRLVESKVLCYTAADTTVTEFLRRYLMGQDGVTVIAVLDTLLDGTTPFVTVVGGTVALCGADSACGQTTGTVCYTPPPVSAITPGTHRGPDDWAGSTVVGPNNGPQVVTNANFAGAGITVKATSNFGHGIIPTNRIALGHPAAAEHLTIDLGAPRLNVNMVFNSFGPAGTEVLDVFSPAFSAVSGDGTAGLANTRVNATLGAGAVTVNFAGPVQFIDFDVRTTSGQFALQSIEFDEIISTSTSQTQGTAAVVRDCETGILTYIDLVTGDPVDFTAITIVDCGAAISETPESLALCDITQVPSLNGARSALNLTALPNGPTAGAFSNGITFTVDQGVPGASGTYLINGSSTQNWTFGQPAMLRFGVNNLNVGAECVTLPAGTVVESVHANHSYNPVTRVLCNGGAAAVTDESIFTLAGASTLAIASNPGGGGQRGLVRLEAALTTFTEVRTPFLRTICRTCGAVPVITDTTMDGLTPYVPAGTVGVCDVPFTPADVCTTASAIGSVCYTPPVAVQTLQDDWTGSTSVLSAGARVWTNSAFAGTATVVTETVTPDTGAALLSNGVRNMANGPATEHTVINLGAPRTNVTVRFDFFGTGSAERLRNVLPAFGAVSGNGTAVLSNTGVDGGPAADGTIFLLFPGPVQTISWDYAPTGAGLSSQTFISFNTGGTANSATAAVLRDCDTGAMTYVDLATGTVLNPAAISIVDCPCCEPEDVVVVAQARLVAAGAPWTPAADAPAGSVTGLTVTVLSGTGSITDGDGTVSSPIPAGTSLSWGAQEERGALTAPQQIAANAGGSLLVSWTVRP